MPDQPSQPGLPDQLNQPDAPRSAPGTDPRDGAPWAPPEQPRVPMSERPAVEQPMAGQPRMTAAAEPAMLDSGSSAPDPVPGAHHAAGALSPLPTAWTADGGPGASVVPPPPLAPTGPGTPSAYPYEATPYAQVSHGQGSAYGAGNYGYSPYGAPPTGHSYPPRYAPYGAAWGHGGRSLNNAQGTAALVLGLVGLALFFSIVFGIILGVLAIVFGALGRAKAQRGEASNGGSALAGVVLGITACAASVVMIFVYIAIGLDEEAKKDEPGGPHDSAAVQALQSPPEAVLPGA
ncbi:DUF4190 domain-containing protein [Streptomyces zagrosensis]|uniref:DUF4190 domain-containing protein n=1 Tax=Streptomyces zagrosensis TaxID=1042984 RepID=A0A7W9UZ53_9ACTN|nr:DUF4190 domain-containing protein [Streptomyces zagrosensis]MBB5936031.1 hypothetical protein [Streptomyces zagrosensis]